MKERWNTYNFNLFLSPLHVVKILEYHGCLINEMRFIYIHRVGM